LALLLKLSPELFQPFGGGVEHQANLCRVRLL
jgi:hypothetical protein